MTSRTPRSSRSRTALLAAGIVWTVAMAAGPDAAAISRFPAIIQNFYQPPLGYEPPCRLCHIQGTTGSGSVQTPFGISTLARGMTSDRGSLTPALMALQRDQVDSDGDGISDIAEILANRDPNTPVDVPLAGSDPSYGCAVAPERANAGTGALILSAVAIGVAVSIRRRRRRSRGIGSR
jgi:MYXO-CTERM domain-containing protein